MFHRSTLYVDTIKPDPFSSSLFLVLLLGLPPYTLFPFVQVQNNKQNKNRNDSNGKVWSFVCYSNAERSCLQLECWRQKQRECCLMQLLLQKLSVSPLSRRRSACRTHWRLAGKDRDGDLLQKKMGCQTYMCTRKLFAEGLATKKAVKKTGFWHILALVHTVWEKDQCGHLVRSNRLVFIFKVFHPRCRYVTDHLQRWFGWVSQNLSSMCLRCIYTWTIT